MHIENIEGTSVVNCAKVVNGAAKDGGGDGAAVIDNSVIVDGTLVSYFIVYAAVDATIVVYSTVVDNATVGATVDGIVDCSVVVYSTVVDSITAEDVVYGTIVVYGPAVLYSTIVRDSHA